MMNSYYNIAMKYILLIIIVLITSCLCQKCKSTCKQLSCQVNNTNYCTDCDSGLYSSAGSCLASAPYTQIIEIIDYNLTSSPFISKIAAQNTDFYAPNLNQIFFPVYFALPEATGNILGFYFQNIPKNYQLQLRASGYLDSSALGCVWNYYSVTWGGTDIIQNTISQFQFTLVYNFTGASGNADIQIINLYSSFTGACVNMYFNEFALIAFLCNTTCASCTSFNFCTSCGQQTGIQTYLLTSLGICSFTCSISYYKNSPDFICDTCDISCSQCTANTPGFCITCNYIQGYVLSYDSSTTCLYTCPPGQYKDTYLLVCSPCNANCLTCSVNSTNCTTCPFSTAGGQLQLSNSQCLINCPSATFANTTANYCSPCHSFCQVCWGSSNSECSRCTNITVGIVTNIYYLAIGSSVCNNGCPQGQYIDSNTPNYCQPCSSLCLYCQNSGHFCINNICPLGYFFYNNSCMSVCLQGTFPNISSSQCQICAVGCISCKGNTLNDCTSCGTVSPGVVYYLSYGTTKCVTVCPLGQYPLTNNLCNLCDPRCTTCQGGSTNCTSCTIVNIVTMVYFYNSTCMALCPDGTYPNSLNSLNNTCSNCNSYCSVCVGPSSGNCTVCQNYTSGTPVVTMIYYKDLNSNTCNTTCPNGQYIDNSLPNICVYCNNICSVCTAANVCLACVDGCFLLPSTLTCIQTCPTGFFQELQTVLVNGVSTMKCEICNQICLTCKNSTSSDCLSCNNMTLTGSTTTHFFMYSANNTCLQTCPNGYVENISINNCDSCQVGCALCEFNASYCTKCLIVSGVNYFLTLLSNSCLKICPDGSFGNSTDLLCYPCYNFTLNGQCLTICPTGYIGNSVGNYSICVLCNQTNKSCSSQFTVQTTVSKNGKQFQHVIKPQLGLSQQSTPDNLKNGLKVYISIDSKSRLLNSVQLQIQGVSLSSDGTRIIIITNYYPITIGTNTSIEVRFRVGALISANGLAYNQVPGIFSINDSYFIKSYFQAFGKNTSLQIEGIIFIAISLLYLLIALIFTNIRAINECLNLIQLLQLIGLCRLRYLPIVFDYYNCLIGFTHYELSFIPNGFSSLFPQLYIQSTVDSVIFTYGTNNFILNFGSIIQLYVPLQILLFALFIYHRQNEQKIKYCKILQQTLVMIWSLLFIFGSILAFMSLQFNSITNINSYFLASFLLSFLILVGYTFYLVFWVRTNLFLQLYKINNILRLVFIFLLFYNLNAAIVVFNFNQLIFIIIDLVFFRSQKRNKWIYAIERIVSIIIINSCMLLSSSDIFLILVGTCLGLLFFFEFCYLFIDILQYFKNKEADRQELESDSIFMSTVEKHISQAKLVSAKINDSHHFINSQIYQKQLHNFGFKTEEIHPPDISIQKQYLKKNESESLIIFDQTLTPRTDVLNQLHKQVRRRYRRTELNIVQKVEPLKQEDIEIIKIEANSQITSNIEICSQNQENNEQNLPQLKSILWNTGTQQKQQDFS